MKILVEKNENYCGDHSLEHTGVQAQLVIIDYCVECNPTRSDFIGIEDGRPLGEAVVMDRPDFDRRSYELTLRAGLKVRLAEEVTDRATLKKLAKAMASVFLDIADAYEPGSVVVREFGEYDIFYRSKASL